MFLTRLLTASAALAIVAGAAHAQAPATAPAPAAAPLAAPVVATGDVVDTFKASGQFTIFLKATDATNLTAFLKARKDVTIFAPTDAAFNALPPGQLDHLMAQANRAELQKLIVYHLVNARVPTSEFKGAVRSAPTMAGLPVELNGGDKLMVNDADIVQPDVIASNGVIQVIDKVLTPGAAPSAAAAGSQASATAPAAKPN